MVRKHVNRPVLSAEQEAEAQLIYERIRGSFDQEAQLLAALMASKPTKQIFGQTEYEVRDRIHSLGAEVLAATAEERVKKGRLSGS